jgi:hypothetical protein
MRFWFVRHPFEWYKKHPDMIDWRRHYAEKSKEWRAIRESDKVIYYSHETPKGIVGLFEVTSNCDETVIKGIGKSLYYRINPLFLPNGGQKPRVFSAKNDVGLSLKPMGTVFELKPEQYRKIKSFLLDMDEPMNHEGVVTLFSKIHTYLGYPRIKTIQTRYPDAVVIDSEGKEKRVEFEFDSDDFRKDMEKGKHDPRDCDVIVCWKDGWGHTRPKKLEMIELQSLYGSQTR